MSFSVREQSGPVKTVGKPPMCYSDSTRAVVKLQDANKGNDS